MRIIRNLIVAFALYSKLPMPIFKWEEKDMELNIAFLPIVGLVLGALEAFVYYIGLKAGLSLQVRALLWLGIIILFTGGFHIDGYMDFIDAIKSYKPKEEKLAIMKDPHTGAFAIINLIKCGLFMFSSLLVFFDGNNSLTKVICASLCFMLVRGFAGFGALTIPLIKKDGMLHEETKGASKKSIIILIAEIFAAFFAALLINPLYGLTEIFTIIVFFLYYRYKCIREFGGINGDCSGYFVVAGEVQVMAMLAIVSLI